MRILALAVTLTLALCACSRSAAPQPGGTTYTPQPAAPGTPAWCAQQPYGGAMTPGCQPTP